MRYFRVVLARLRGLFGGQRADDDLREELESHLEMETAELIRRGMDAETARRQAQLASGGITQAAGRVREQRGLPWIESTLADLRFGLRSLHRNPGFTAVVVITLALGIGATTAIFSVVRGVLLKPLPHRDGDRLVYLRQSTDGLGGENMLFSVPEIRDLRAGAPAELDGGEPDAAGAGVDQHPLAGPDPGEHVQRVVRGEHRHGDSGRLLGAQVRRAAHHERRRHRDVRAEHARVAVGRGDRRHPVTDGELGWGGLHEGWASGGPCSLFGAVHCS